MIVVSDTSPLNYLILIGREGVLPVVFGEVVVPTAVLNELMHPRSPSVTRTWATRPPSWLHVRDPKTNIEGLALDLGERAAIALAEEIRADRLLIDERAGREVAASRGLRVVGTIAVLVEASRRGLLELPTTLERLRSTSFHVRQDVIDEALRNAGARAPNDRPTA